MTFYPPVILWLTLAEARCLPLSVKTWRECASWLCPVKMTCPRPDTVTNSTVKLRSCAAGRSVRMYCRPITDQYCGHVTNERAVLSPGPP